MCGRALGYEYEGQVYSRATLIEIRGVYDGGLFYADVQGCGRAWHRWSDISAYTRGMRDKAQPYIDRWNEAHEEPRNGI
jgi:hypothetical protein